MTLHDHLACPSCWGDGRMVVEVIYNGDCSYEDVRDCDRCDGTGLRCLCPVHPVTWENRSCECLVHGEPGPVDYVRAEDTDPLPF